MQIGHRNPTQGGPYDTEKSLVCPANEEVFEVRSAVADFPRSAVDRTVDVSRVMFDGSRLEYVAGDD